MTPDRKKPGPPQPHRRRDYPLRKDPRTRIMWRLAYLDSDFGRCYAWAPTLAAAKLMRAALIKHYDHDTQWSGPPEVLIGRALIPIGTRQELAAWLTQHANYDPPHRPATARAASPMTPDA